MKTVLQFLCQIVLPLILFLLSSSCVENKVDQVQDIPELELHEQPMIKGDTENGKREGKWTSYFTNGNIQSECFYVDGLNHGSTKVYLENGQLLYEGEYNYGSKSGRWTFIDSKSGSVTHKEY